jgi:hypothetical protein
MFFFKTKPIELVAFTDSQVLAELFPITKALHDLPAYYRNLPIRKKIDNPIEPDNALNYFPTMRRCYGANQFHITGINLPLWQDYSILTNAKGESSCASPIKGDFFEFHNPEQSTEVWDDFTVMKIKSPWRIRCKENVKFLMTANQHTNHSQYWQVINGILNFKMQAATHIFLGLNKNRPIGEMILNAGSTIAKLVPLTERPVNVRIEIIDDISKKDIMPSKFFFNNALTDYLKKQIRKNALLVFKNNMTIYTAFNRKA